MSNLLPKEEKGFLKKLYRSRLISVSLVLLLILVLISVTLIVPIYLIFRVQLSESEARLETESQIFVLGEEGDELSIEDVRELQDKVNFLLKEDDRPRLSSRMSIFLETLPGGVFLDTISVNESMIEVRGESVDRETLLLFIRSLEEHEMVASVDSPISNLIDEEDIQFTIRVTLI